MKPPNLNLTNFAKVPKIPNSSKPANGKDGSLYRMLHCTHLPQSIIEGWGKEACGLSGGEVPPLPLIALADNKCRRKIKKPIKIAFLWILFFVLNFGCEIYSEILTKPDYEPSLVIHAILSPQEGGDVYIKYTQPVDSTNVQPVPALPELSVELYENGTKKNTLTKIDEGHFTLDTAGLVPFPDRDYHIEVTDHSGNVILKSGKERLPSLPDVVFTRFYEDTTTFPEENYLEVEFNLNPVTQSSYQFRTDYSIDNGEVFIRGRDPEYGRFSIRRLVHADDYPDGVYRQTLNIPTFKRPEPGADNQYVDAVKLWVDHLSPGLTRFLQDVADTNEAYGDPFATKSPVYSNIEGGYGVFGMYNSWVGVVHLE